MQFNRDRLFHICSKQDLNALYWGDSLEQQQSVLDQLGSLKPVFAQFIANERCLIPLPDLEVIRLFDQCSNLKEISAKADRSQIPYELQSILKKLSPGNGKIGFRQVNLLVDHLRAKVQDFVHQNYGRINLIPHDHAFGSGGDFVKTLHATTWASVIAAPLVKICKTGTQNVTSLHGSQQAIAGIQYQEPTLNSDHLNHLLQDYGFVFLSLASFGFPYSNSLRQAREILWKEARLLIELNYQKTRNWQQAVQDSKITIDIMKVVSPNAQVLNPRRHSTGVPHLSMLPYVLGIYLHLGTQGIISHCYDGIDELSNAMSDPKSNQPNNLVIKVETDQIQIAEFFPEDIGLERANLDEIGEESITREVKDFWEILVGKQRSSRQDYLLANVAAILVASQEVNHPNADLLSQLQKGVLIGRDLIESQVSYHTFIENIKREI